MSDRFIWTVKILDIDPDGTLLEIGCGHGIAVSLICKQLKKGKVTAIDRSAKMITQAQKRNEKWLHEGKVSFNTSSLETLDLGTKKFSKIFAVNVNTFWIKPEKALESVKKLLVPKGKLYLFYHPAWGSLSAHEDFVDKQSKILEENGFFLKKKIVEPLTSVTGICVIAEVK